MNMILSFDEINRFNRGALFNWINTSIEYNDAIIVDMAYGVISDYFPSLTPELLVGEYEINWQQEYIAFEVNKG